MAFWGGFLATAFILGTIILVIRSKIRQFSSRLLGNPDILDALEDLDLEVQESPRSLSGCDSLLLPRILADFPDFDAVMAKTYAREFLHSHFGGKENFTVYNIVIAKYLPSEIQKTIVFQAAVSWLEEGRRIQKRFDMNYTYILKASTDTVAANCPNCGGAIGYGQTQCPYCSSRVTNVLGNIWEFTQMQES